MRPPKLALLLGAAAGALLAAAPATAAVTTSVAGGQLSITDSPSGAQANSVTVACTRGTLFVAVSSNPPTNQGSCASITAIVIAMGAGSDSVDLSALNPANMPNVTTVTVGLGGVSFSRESPDTNNSFTGGGLAERVSAGVHSSSITTGAGDDTITVGELGFFLGTIDTVDGGSGTDTIRALSLPGGTTTLAPGALTRPLAGTMAFTGIERGELEAGPGADQRTLDAGTFTGPVTLTGGDGADTLIAGAGGSTLDGGGDVDTLVPGAGVDDLRGGPGVDSVSGAFSGTLGLSAAALGADSLSDIEGVKLSGSPGPDTLAVTGFTGAVELDGGGGTDAIDVTATGPSPTTTALASPAPGVLTVARSGAAAISAASVENAVLRGGDGADTLDATASPGPVTIVGGDGNDTIALGPGGGVADGGPGDDVLRPGPANETLIGGPGTDTLLGDRGTTFGNVVLTPGALTVGSIVHTLDGIETANLTGSAVADAFDTTAFPRPVAIDAGAGNDRVRTGPAPDVLRGGPGNDDLDGGGGDDVIDGGEGDDFLHGGPGGPGDGDVLIGGPGFDMLSYASRTTPVRVTLDGIADDGGPGEGDQADPTLEGVIGGSADDVIVLQQGSGSRSLRRLTGTAPVRVAYGGAGHDNLTGSPLADILGGGPGDDRIDSRAGNDAVHGGSGNDILGGGPGNDRVYGERGVDRIDLGPGDDVAFSLDSAKDTVTCGTGTDQVYSGLGDVLRPTCNRVTGTRLSRAVTAAGAREDGTDLTLQDGDGVFGLDGDSPLDLDGDGLSFLNGDAFDDFGFTDDGFGFFDDFGLGFDDDFFGEGFDDFGDAFGDDLGGKRPPAARVTTTALALQKNRYALRVTCPKKVDRRCLGEVTVTLRTKGKARRIGRVGFGINAGRATTRRLTVSRASQTAIRKAKAKRLEVTLEGRDRGDGVWQETKQVRIAATKAKKAPARKKTSR